MPDPAGQQAERFELLGLREVQRELLLDVGDLLGLRLFEVCDLALLCPLGAQVGEGQAGQLVAVDVDVERGGADQDGHEVAVVVEELELEGGAEPVGTFELLRRDGDAAGQEA